MQFGIIFITLALVFYTTAIWSEKIKNELNNWMLVLFIFAFLSDITGTSIMYFISTARELNFHSLCGYTALIIMFLHLSWAILAKLQIKKCEIYFHKFSIFAWIVWLTAFFSGVPK